MNIYFSGSIRAGRSEVERYSKIIDYLGKYGTVLTHHIGNKDVTEQGEEASALWDAVIHDRNIVWLESADAVVAEVTQPSLGVGYEIGRASQMDKPVLCLFQTDKVAHNSAMISGNNKIRVVNCGGFLEVTKVIDKFFEDFNIS